MDINWNGVLFGSTMAYQVMAKQGFGHIINTASATGLPLLSYGPFRLFLA